MPIQSKARNMTYYKFIVKKMFLKPLTFPMFLRNN